MLEAVLFFVVLLWTGTIGNFGQFLADLIGAIGGQF
jgi:hypothetical protein